MGSDYRLQGNMFVPVAPGANGEHHRARVRRRLTNVSMKIAQLRADYQKVGFDMTQATNFSGFGVLHDGSVDSIGASSRARLLRDERPGSADLVAFILVHGLGPAAGIDTAESRSRRAAEPDAHAAVGFGRRS
jgi:hypothetical protein